MLDTKQFASAIKQISEEKGISEGSVFETIEAAIAAAYKREYGKKGQVIRTGIAEIPSLSRSTQGVRVMKLRDGDAIASFVCL